LFDLKMKRSVWIFLCLMPVAVQAADASRPNIVLILADDQAPGLTGFEGHPQIKTPSLDRLAAGSMHFTRCYVPTPQCAPSRACVLTGLYPHSHGVTTNGPALPIEADTFSARLKRAGYTCGIVGKWHLPYKTAASPGFGFEDYAATHNGGWSWIGSKVFVQGTPAKAGEHLVEWHTNRAIDFLEKSAKKPFFLWLCYRSPHAPLEEPPGKKGLYPPKSIELPDTMDIDENNAFPNKVKQSPPVNAFKKHNKQTLREARSKYYAMITHLDEYIGKVLDKLDQLELSRKTIVVFVSDNGWALGDHRLFSKGPFFYDELIRMPLLVRWPGRVQKGVKIDRVVSMVDLAPTILSMAGQTPPVTMQGQSLVRLIDNPESRRHADECFLEYDEQKGKKYAARGIVTRNYKFVDYMREPNDVLFDLRRDPKELHNVAGDPEYAAIVQTLRNRIDAWRRTTRDPLTEK